MSEMNIKTVHIQKHDTEENWSKSSLVPSKGQIIIYDPDANYNYARIKIGDGANTVTNLSFINNHEDFLNKHGDTMLGPLCLIEDIGFGLSLPESADNGRLFFIENNDPTFPKGGETGQYLVKNSDMDGDAGWQDLPPLDYLPITGGTLTGSVEGTTFKGTTFEGTATQIQASASTDKMYMLGTSAETDGSHNLIFNTSVYTENSVLFGAAWNDYAEYRICNDEFIPGQVVCENGDDTLSISSRRLQPGANIISDTFGFAIGETYQAKCPIAVAGRVLAYTYEPREEFKAGDAVCAGPNGTVSKMSRLEIIKYPERIIGTVSAIPNYEYWGEKNIFVNNRIWIKI